MKKPNQDSSKLSASRASSLRHSRATGKVRKMIIPAAGFGTRFLPWTKAVPKELIPLVRAPILEKIVRQYVDAGVEEVVIVLSPGKEAIKNYFSPFPELENQLRKTGKTAQLRRIRELNRLAKISYIYQSGPLGNATPILNCAGIIGEEPFFVSWADDFIRTSPSMPKRLLEGWRKYPGQWLGGLVLPRPQDKKRYGYVAGKEIEPGIIKAEKIIEKPGPKAPSDIGIISDYLYTPKIFQAIKDVSPPPADQELVYTLAVDYLIKQGEPVYVRATEGTYADCGNPEEYLKVVVEEALADPKIGKSFGKWLRKRASNL